MSSWGTQRPVLALYLCFLDGATLSCEVPTSLALLRVLRSGWFSNDWRIAPMFAVGGLPVCFVSEVHVSAQKFLYQRLIVA